MQICEICRREFESTNSKRKYCSFACKQEAAKERQKARYSRLKEEGVCPMCGKPTSGKNVRCESCLKEQREKRAALSGKHLCKIFSCDKKHMNLCCHYCNCKDKCKRRCLNSPDKCGQLKYKIQEGQL